MYLARLAALEIQALLGIQVAMVMVKTVETLALSASVAVASWASLHLAVAVASWVSPHQAAVAVS